MGNGRKKKTNSKKNNGSKEKKLPEISAWQRVKRSFFKRKLSKGDQATVSVARWTLALVIIGVITAWAVIKANRADVEVIEVRFDPNPMIAEVPTKLIVKIKNAGKSTAQIAGGDMRWGWHEGRDSTLAMTLPYAANNITLGNNYRTHIIPDQTASATLLPKRNGIFKKFSSDMIAQMYSENAHYWVYGHFSYTDQYSVPLIGSMTASYCYTFSPVGGGFIDCNEEDAKSADK